MRFFIFSGSWLEFGVWEGATLNGVADYRKVNCDANAAPVFGFDTFTGLPEDWGAFRPTVSFACWHADHVHFCSL